uniref:uncharacterized protein LOC100177649 isoform X2 n=1 Tax=Ciona intestinalis TaxID=7719 RepID=UPI000EF4C464|nr:uncharacterized protein LOC100177649 isoform X2 [Ciona intestinalis]|eukprot:XP_026690731.1 uncharacterized protein LOC100177649 isoform X2 [Ciona intestinalis]
MLRNNNTIWWSSQEKLEFLCPDESNLEKLNKLLQQQPRETIQETIGRQPTQQGSYQQQQTDSTPFIQMLKNLSNELKFKDFEELKRMYGYCTENRSFGNACELFLFLENENKWGGGTLSDKLETLLKILKRINREDLNNFISDFKLDIGEDRQHNTVQQDPIERTSQGLSFLSIRNMKINAEDNSTGVKLGQGACVKVVEAEVNVKGSATGIQQGVKQNGETKSYKDDKANGVTTGKQRNQMTINSNHMNQSPILCQNVTYNNNHVKTKKGKSKKK